MDRNASLLNTEYERLDLTIKSWKRLDDLDEEELSDEESEAHIDVLGLLNSLSAARLFVQSLRHENEGGESSRSTWNLLERLIALDVSNRAACDASVLDGAFIVAFVAETEELRRDLRVWVRDAMQSFNVWGR